MCLPMSKHYEKHGGNPLLWLDKWEASKGIEEHERTHIEMSCHMRTLYYFGTYDQMNLGASAALENVARRVAQIVEAYRVDAARPAWHTVKHFAGDTSALDPVPQTLKAWNARRTKDELEAENLRQRQRGLLTPAGADAGDDAGVRTSAPARAAPGGRGRGRGRRPRGLQPPVPG